MRKCTDVCMVGGGGGRRGKFVTTTPKQTFAKFREFEELYPRFKLSNLKALFSVVWTDFPNLSMSKVEKNCENVYKQE